MKIKISFLLLACFFVLSCGFSNKTDSGEAEIKFNSFRDIPGITEEEIKAIESFQRQGVSFVYGISPGTEAFVNADGELNGFTVLFCQWLTELFGLSFIPQLFDWDEVLSGLESGEIDFTGELTATPERRKNYIMTDAIATRFVSYFRIAGSAPLSDIAKTRPLRYGFFSGTITYDDVLEHRDAGFVPFFVDNYEESYSLLINGEIDAFIDEHTSEAAYENYGNVVVETFFPVLFGNVSLATQKNANAPVISIVQKFLESGGIRHLAELYNRGENQYTRHKVLAKLTPQERSYLRSNPTVKFAAEHDNYPISFYNTRDDEFQGICFDVLKEIESLTGLRFELVNDRYDDWNVILKMLEDGEASMISELVHIPEREDRFLWTQTPVLTDYHAFLSKEEHRNIRINEIMNIKVGLVDGYAQTELFNKWFPGHQYTVTYDNFTQAMEALERDEIEMVMGSQIMLLIMTNFHELPGYKANLVLDYPYPSTFGFNKNEDILCSIIDKTLQVINTQEIEVRWKGKTYDYRFKIAQARLPWLISVIGLLFCVLVLVLFLFYRSKRYSRIQEESEYKSIFLANMSHEIRTPMNAITGMTEMLLRGDLSYEMRCYAQDIKNAGNNLISIINDILDISKIEAGKLEIIPVNYMLSSLVNDTVNIIRARLTEKSIWFETKIDEKIPNNLAGDEVRLRQIILNLLSNAVKYTETGGINFSIELEKIDGEMNDAAFVTGLENVQSLGKAWLKITVTDTGKGIKPEDQEKLFNNFVQVDKRKNTGIEGTGLGLAITKRLCDAMNGNISLESEYGKGSVFTVLIPQDIVSLEPIGAFEVIEPNYNENTLTIKHTFSGARVLVVDDLPLNIKVVEGLLLPYEVQVDTCVSGEESIELAKQNEYDIIFMDHMMPGMDGMEAAKIIREFNTQVPIVALTANAVVGMKEKFIENGFNDFLSKPIDIPKLDEIIERWIGKKTGNEESAVNSEQLTANSEEKKEIKYNEINHRINKKPPHIARHSPFAVNKNVSKKFILFSVILFGIICLVAFIAYSISAQQMNKTYIEQQLSIASETMRLRLATTVNSELSLVLKMADTPAIRQYFENPYDQELSVLANAEIALYEQHFKSKQAFWVSDEDKIFHSTGNQPYIIDPDDPESYWYNMTLYETDLYNLNINYNLHMQQINLWVNVPVFVEKKPVGMLGTGIDLTEFSEFIASGYRDFDNKITPFIFNKFDEITASLDYDLVFNKVRIDEHLGESGKELIARARQLKENESINFVHDNNIYQISYISALDWFVVVIHPDPGLLSLNDAMNTVFFSMVFLIFLMFLIINIFIYRSENTMAQQNQQLIEATREAEAASKAKSEFLGKISHEIRTPINAITGINELILRSDIPDEIRDYAKDIKQAGVSLTSLINNILDFSVTGYNKPVNEKKLDEILKERGLGAEIRDWRIFNKIPDSQISISGVDTKKGIANTGGTTEKYKQVLKVFCENAEERLGLLQSVPSAEFMPVFIMQVHALKGALAIIGSKELSDQAAALESAGKDNDYDSIKEKLPVFYKQLSELKDKIKAAIGNETKP